MAARDTVWTYVSVTGVAVLIWFWAASATREQRDIRGQLLFAPAGASADWVVQPRSQPVQITLEGSRWSLQKAVELFRAPLTIDLLSDIGTQTRDLATELSRNVRVRETGIHIIACEPASAEIAVDRRERSKAPIRVNLTGVQTTGEIEVDPPEAFVTMPSKVRGTLPSQLTLEADVPASQLKELAAGVKHTLNVVLRLPGAGAGTGAENRAGAGSEGSETIIEPTAAKVSFMIRSRTEETVLDSVRVQVAGPHQDFDDYDVELTEDALRSVTVSGESELIRRIAAGEVRVVAMVHLSTNDKERGIRGKRVSTFLAIAPDGSATPVTARVGGSAEPPEISLTITKRPRPAPVETVPPSSPRPLQAP